MENNMKTSKSPQRQLELMEYFNELKDNKCTHTDKELMDIFNYTNRMTLSRDLKSLEEKGYLEIKTSVLTPVNISDGTATQYVKKMRTIRFKTSENGLVQFKSEKLDQLSHCGHPFYSRSYHQEYLKNQKYEVRYDTLVRK